MNADPDDELNRKRALAEALDCILDEDLQVLADVKATTTDAWRKRGKGPDYVLFGNAYLYPRPGVKKHLDEQTRARKPVKVELL